MFRRADTGRVRTNRNVRIDRAIASVLEPLERRTLLSVAVSGIPNWIEQGPGPTFGGSGQGIPNQPVSGAIEAVAVHPDDANIIWIGSVNGGIWKTTDGGTTWSPKTDQFPTAAISTLSLDPNNPNTIWAGTARTTSGGSIGGSAGGLLKSTDGGETWAVYPAGLVGGSLGVHAVLPTKIIQGSGHVVLVGTDQNLNMGGLLRSTDGGTGTFDRISGIADDGEDNDLDNLVDAADPSEQNGLPAGTVDSIVADPANINRIYVGMRGKGVFVSNNGGATWNATPNLESVVGANSSNFAKIQHTIRVHLSISTASATTGNRPVYAATIVTVKDSLFEAVPSSGERKQIVVSPNTLIEPGDFVELEKSPTVREKVKVVSRTFGNNVWTLTLEKGLTNSYPLNTPVHCLRFDSASQERVSGLFRSDDNGANWVFLGIPGDVDGGISPVGQADKHFSMLADKDDPNIVYVGGDTQPGPHPNSSGGVHNSGRLFQATFNPSNNGTTWQPIVATGALGTAPHPDSRAMVMDKFGDIIEVDDGGIYKLSLAGTSLQKWVSLNGDLRLMEFNSVASSNGLILGGAQDNGVALQSTLGGVLWNRLLEGDGQIVRAAGSTQLYSSQNLGGFTIDGLRPALNVAGTGKKLNEVDQVRFAEPYVLNAVDPGRMLIGQARLFESVKLPTLPLGDLLMPLGGGNGAVVGSIFPNAMVYGGWEGVGNPKPDIGWVGTRGDPRKPEVPTLFVRQSGLYGAFVPVESWAAGPVVAIDVDPTNWREVFLLDIGGHIWHSASGGEKPNEVGKWKWSQLNEINTLVDVAGTSQFSDIDVARKGDKRAILVSGLAGVFRRIETLESGVWVPGPWTRFGGGPIVNGVADPFGGGLPNSQVTELHLPNDPSVYLSATPGLDDRILVGTHGRGAFTATLGDELFETATVSIASGAGNQMITLRREAARPWVLDVFEYSVGSPEPSTPTRRLPLASIQEIFIDAGPGNDQITIDYTNGAIAVPNGIAISGGDDSDTLKIVNTGFEILPDRKLETVGPQTVSTITTYDPFAQQGVQRVMWDASIETPPPAAQVSATNGIDVIRTGLNSSSQSLRRGTSDALAGQKVAGFDARSIAGAIGGRRVEVKAPEPDVGDGGAAISGPDPASQNNNATSILARLIQEGLNGFAISDIGSVGRINTLSRLREALDALDATPGNVTLDTTRDLDGDSLPDTQFNVRILDRALDGLINLDVDANTTLGEVSLFGNAEFDAKVDLDLVFGIDGRGFFLKPSSAGTPAIRLSEIKIDGNVGGTGRFGFLGVNLTDATLTVDPHVSIDMSLVDPGSDAADQTIRFPELFPSDYTTLLHISVKGDPGDGAGNEDVVLDGTFGVTAILGSDEAPLFSADAKLSFADLADPTSLTFTPDVNGTLSSLFGIDATTFLNNVLGAAEQIKQATGVDVFATQIPVLDRSLDEILGGSVEETFTEGQFLRISSVFTEDGFNKFRVTFNGINPLERGIAVGNTVKFTGTDDVVHDGEIDAVDHASFTVKFDPSNPIGPEAETGASIKVTRQGSTRDMIESWLGELANPVGLSARVPTLQDMIAALGIDAAGVRLSAGSDAIEIPIAFALDPITFSHKLDLGTTIAGLQLSTAGNVDVEIAPAFKFSMGVRFTGGVPVAERIYLKEDDDAEVTLGLKVTLDDPMASGRIGFLDVALSEDTPNDGVEFLGTIKLNLLDTVGGDGRIVVSELEAGDLLNSFETDISADFLINPLKIVATVGDSTELGKITIKLDAADGHVASLADLQDLPSKIQVTGESNFSNFRTSRRK